MLCAAFNCEINYIYQQRHVNYTGRLFNRKARRSYWPWSHDPIWSC